jgi:hypothetical protein
VLAMLAMSGFVAATGWLSDLRRVLHGGLILLSVAAFLPLLVAMAIVVVFLAASAMAIAAGTPEAIPTAADAYATGEGLTAFFRRVLVPYYRFLFAQRHPITLGAACGLLLGTLFVWTLLSLFVLPGEVCTLKRMAAIQSAIQGWSAGFPRPVRDQRIDEKVLGTGVDGWPFCSIPSVEANGTSAILLDGFGRPLGYTVEGHWPLTSYRLSSLGYDGRASGDDLCLSGSSHARAALDRIAGGAAVIHALLTHPSSEPGLHHWWSAVRETTCPSSEP